MTAPDLDLAVIGGGPAGLAAAILAADLGLKTALYDEQAAPGGQVWRAVEAAAGRPDGFRDLLGADFARGADLVRRFRASGADYRPGHAVFDLDPDGGFGVLSPAGATWVRARRVLVAAGAMERPVPVPGWTLPGVLTAGAAQTLLKSAAMVPRGRCVIAGSGPLTLLVARQLLAAGGNIVAVLDTTPAENTRRAAPLLPAAWRAWREIVKGLRWRSEARRGAPHHAGVREIEILGPDAVTGIAFTSGGRRARIACDLVLLHEGVVPNAQLTLALGAEHRFDSVQACWRPVVDAFGRTSVATVVAAGDGAGIGGADLAVEAGEMAALAVALDLEVLDSATVAARARGPRSQIARLAGLRRFLDTLYRPRAEVLAPPGDDTVICRCEEVTAGTLRQVVGLGCQGPNQAKAFTRCGMGPCQARMCGLPMAAVVAEALGRSLAEVEPLRVRPPIKPITVGELAGLEGVGPPPATGPMLPTRPADPGAEGTEP